MLQDLERIFAPLIGNPRGLWKRYILALGVIVVLVGGSHMIQHRAIAKTTFDAEIINVAGRQRMLSQRIMFLALQYQNAPAQSTLDGLDQAVSLFESSHDWIMNLEHLPPHITGFYAGRPGAPGLDQNTRAYIDQGRIVINAAPDSDAATMATAYLVAEGQERLLKELDQAVRLLEADAKKHSTDLSQAARIVVIVAVALIILESFFIFIPAQLGVNSALNGLEERNREIAKQKAKLEETARELDFAAHHDSLTGLVNRKFLFDRLETSFQVGDLDSRRMCLMHVDLDLFKEVNDTHGHPAGDAVLVEVARRMKDKLRDRDLVARIGGDEFVVVADYRLSDGVEYAMRVADTLIAAISLPIEFGDKQLYVGASIGMAFATHETPTPDLLIARSDEALYEAKRAGRGTARCYDTWLPKQPSRARINAEDSKPIRIPGILPTQAQS